MGRKSREKKNRREGQGVGAEHKAPGTDAKAAEERITEIEKRLRWLSDGEYELKQLSQMNPEERVSHLEDIFAFESVSEGISLFEGLEARGISLPPPTDLDEERCADKALEVANALAELQHVFLLGFDQMTGREFYSKLWEETLWEACFIERKNPGGMTFMDVSGGRWGRAIRRQLEEMLAGGSVN